MSGSPRKGIDFVSAEIRDFNVFRREVWYWGRTYHLDRNNCLALIEILADQMAANSNLITHDRLKGVINGMIRARQTASYF